MPEDNPEYKDYQPIFLKQKTENSISFFNNYKNESYFKITEGSINCYVKIDQPIETVIPPIVYYPHGLPQRKASTETSVKNLKNEGVNVPRLIVEEPKVGNALSQKKNTKDDFIKSIDLNTLYILLFSVIMIFLFEIAKNLASYLVPKKIEKDGREIYFYPYSIDEKSEVENETKKRLVLLKKRIDEYLAKYKKLEKPMEESFYDIDFIRVVDELKFILKNISIQKIDKALCKKILIKLIKELKKDAKTVKLFTEGTFPIEKLPFICKILNDVLFSKNTENFINISH